MSALSNFGPLLDREIQEFNSNLLLWSDRWWQDYCFDGSNQISGTFHQDWKRYFPFFFPGMSKELSTKNILNDFEIQRDLGQLIRYFNNFKLEPQIGTHYSYDSVKALYEWKFTARNWDSHKEKVVKVATGELGVATAYPVDRALVANIFWLHAFDPLEFPIFDQRTLRSWLLLSEAENNLTRHPHSLWRQGVPMGVDLALFYKTDRGESLYTSQDSQAKISGKARFADKILDVTAQFSSDSERFMTLRKIDWALFAFDRQVISRLFSREIPIDKTIAQMVETRLSLLGK